MHFSTGEQFGNNAARSQMVIHSVYHLCSWVEVNVFWDWKNVFTQYAICEFPLLPSNYMHDQLLIHSSQFHISFRHFTLSLPHRPRSPPLANSIGWVSRLYVFVCVYAGFIYFIQFQFDVKWFLSMPSCCTIITLPYNSMSHINIAHIAAAAVVVHLDCYFLPLLLFEKSQCNMYLKRHWGVCYIETSIPFPCSTVSVPVYLCIYSRIYSLYKTAVPIRLNRYCLEKANDDGAYHIRCDGSCCHSVCVCSSIIQK